MASVAGTKALMETTAGNIDAIQAGAEALACVPRKPSIAASAAAMASAEDALMGDLSCMFTADGDCEQLEQEDDEGNVEYKLKLVDPTPERFDRLVSQMKFRLAEGQGEALYEIGVTDDGTPQGLNETQLEASINTLKRMAKEIDAEVQIVHVKSGTSAGHSMVEALVRSLPSASGTIETRVAVVGNVDSGKSTLIGVLTRGELDNGRGLARNACFRHKHEIDNGRTSSVSQQFLGFDNEGDVTNYTAVRGAATTQEMLTKSSKIVNFIDLCGHERYLKTTVFGLTGAVPDYSMIMLGANMGVQRMTREHLGLTLALRLPFFIVITKIDLAPPNVREETISRISRILKSANVRKMPYLVNDEEGVISCSKQMGDGTRVVPIFQVSNVTGEGLPCLRLFLNLLPSKREWSTLRDEKFEFYIDDVFQVPGVGTVVAGTVTKGNIALVKGQGPMLLLGPDSTGAFRKVQVKGIHTKSVSVAEVHAGQSASFAVKTVGGTGKAADRVLKKSMIRKGMVLLDPEIKPRATRCFAAEVVVLHHPTTIKRGYQPVVHARTVRQVASIEDMNTELLRTGTRARVRFRFRHFPEYLTVGTPIVFREGRTKGMGIIKRVIYDGDEVNPMAKKDVKQVLRNKVEGKQLGEDEVF
jgi:GTPase